MVYLGKLCSSYGGAFGSFVQLGVGGENCASLEPNAGILLPEKTNKLNSGKVVAVGPGVRGKHGDHIPVSVKEGDTVLLPEYGATEVKLGDKLYHLYRDEDILGTLHD